MARPTKGRGKTPAQVSRREKEIERDVFEAEDNEAEEDRLKNRYDNVESYEYELPSDFEDEEIDEDTAFTAEDEELYGHLFADKDDGGSEEDEGHSDEGRQSDENNPLLDSGDEDVSGTEDDELDEVFSSSAEEEEEGGPRAEEDAAAHAALLAAVTGGLKKRREGRAGTAAVTEAYPESEHGLPSAEGLSVSDLMAGLGTSQAALGSARKALTRMEEKHKTVEPPLPGPIKARLERKAGYEHAREDVSKWQSMVNANRNAPTLRFIGERGPGQESTSLPALIAAHAPSTSMEEEVAALLNAAGAHSAKALSEAEEKLAARSLSAEEARERRDRLAKMRALLYYHEVKAKRLKKIKSKEYRRHLRRAEMRKAKKLGVLTTDEDGVDTIRVDRESAEFDRMRERLTLKHKNTSSWARRAIRRGLAHQDADTRAAIAEQLRRGQELTRKAERQGSDDDQDEDEALSTSASESEDDDATDQATRARNKARAAALEVLRGAETEEAPTQGLLALPFMKRALEKRKQAAVQEARRALAEDDDGAENNANSTSLNGRRMSFSGGGNSLKSQVVAEEDDMASDSELEADERETVEEKRQRLARSIAGERAEQAARAAQAAADAAKSADKLAGSSNKKRQEMAESSLGPPPKSHVSNGFVSAAPASGKKTKPTKKQESASQDAPTISNAPAAFQPAKKFSGARAGYVFKKGPKGLGYYPDGQAAALSEGDAEPKVKKKTTEIGRKRDRAAETLLNTNSGDSGSKKRTKEDEQGKLAVNSSRSMAPAKNAANNQELLSQDDLIRMAFAGDDVIAEFAAEKAAEVERELPKEEEIGVLPGWGAWSGAQNEPAWMSEARRKSAQKRQQAAAARKDAKMQFVVLSEKWDKKAAKYRTSTVPFPYDSKQTYERARRQPLGREFNTDEAFRDLTRPAVLKDSGVVIQPLRYTEGLGTVAKNLPRRAARNPVNTVQAGRLKSTARAK